MIITKKQKLRPAIESLSINDFLDLPKDDFTASAARQAVNRILKSDKIKFDIDECRKFHVSETSYLGGTRVTRKF